MEELTNRQWALYTLLRENPNKWFTEKEICELVSGYEYIEKPNHSTTHCASIFNDKNKINEHPKPDGIIVMKKHCFKMANKQEYVRERNEHIRALRKQIEFINALDSKNARNGQFKLLNSDLNELKETNKQFYETYLEEREEE